MDNGLEKIFNNLDYFAECASNIELAQYNGVIRSEHIASLDGSEQRAYFCAVPKSNFSCMGEAVPLLFIYNLYDSEEWEKDDTPPADLDKTEWKNILTRIWIPEYFAISKDCANIDYEITKEEDFRKDWFPIVNKIVERAILSPVQQIVRYGMIKAWNYYDYLIETETEYINFQYWTTA